MKNQPSDRRNHLFKVSAAAHDPTPKAITGGGQLSGQDYTKFIKWNPLSIAIAIVIPGGVYLAIVTLVWSKLGVAAGLMILSLSLIPALGVGIMYWLSKAVL